MNDFPFEKHGVITFENPKEIQEKARFFGEKRTQTNSKLHEVAPEYDRGSLASSVDELGVTAELIAVQFLTEKNIKHTALEIIEERPIKSADVFIDGFKIDVKGVRADNSNLTVNCKAHFQKDVTHYWFIKIQKNENGELIGKAEYWIISALLVTYWERRSSFTDYFYKAISEINITQ
jgi:hypothetical protein